MKCHYIPLVLGGAEVVVGVPSLITVMVTQSTTLISLNGFCGRKAPCFLPSSMTRSSAGGVRLNEDVELGLSLIHI